MMRILSSQVRKSISQNLVIRKLKRNQNSLKKTRNVFHGNLIEQQRKLMWVIMIFLNGKVQRCKCILIQGIGNQFFQGDKRKIKQPFLRDHKRKKIFNIIIKERVIKLRVII